MKHTITLSAFTILSCGCVEYIGPDYPDYDNARTQMAQVQSTTARFAEEFSNVMASLRVVEPLQMLINEPPALPIPLYYEADLTLRFGVYTENNLGAYDYQQSVNPSIVVTKRNGIVINVNNFTFEQDLRLSSMTIQVLSNQNGIDTLASEELELQLTQQWRTSTSTQFAPSLSTGLHTTGTATYSANGSTPTIIEITHSHGFLREADPLVESPLLWIGQSLSITDLTEGDINPKSYMKANGIQYVPSDAAGVWVASIIYKGLLGLDFYSNVRAELTSNAVAASGLAEYSPQGRVVSRRKITAFANGGPWQCAINDPLATGTGIKINIYWLDGQFPVDLFPSPDQDCSQVIITEIGF